MFQAYRIHLELVGRDMQDEVTVPPWITHGARAAAAEMAMAAPAETAAAVESAAAAAAETAVAETAAEAAAAETAEAVTPAAADALAEWRERWIAALPSGKRTKLESALAGGILRTSTRPVLHRRIESARL
jgi:hypothetical protein